MSGETTGDHLCFFLGGPHHNSAMRRKGKPTSGFGTLTPDLSSFSTDGGPRAASVSWGMYRLEATIGDGIDGPIAALAVGPHQAVPIAIYAWIGDPS